MTKPRIALIVSSTRKTRFADIPAAWFKSVAEARDDLDIELVDLRDYPMPFFDEMASNAYVPTQDPVALKWQAKLAEFDGYIFVVAEYNRSITAALKNALDHAYVEWGHKPMGAVAYGSMGGTSALQHLRQIAVELQMVPVRSAVLIGASDFFAVQPAFGGKASMADIAPRLMPSAKALLDDMAWWAKATMAAKAEPAAVAAA